MFDEWLQYPSTFRDTRNTENRTRVTSREHNSSDSVPVTVTHRWHTESTKCNGASILLGTCLALFTRTPYLIRAALERIYQKRIHIRFSISHRQPAVSRMSPIRSILYSSLPAYARRHDTEECQINTGWNISAVGFCDPGIFVPFEGWIFGCFLCCSVIFSRGPAVCCTGGTPIMFWNPVRIFLL